MRACRILILLLACVALAACDTLGLDNEPNYTGEFAGQLVRTEVGGITCTWTYAVTGRVELELEESGSNVSGDGTVFVEATPGPSPNCGGAPHRKWDGSGAISGTASDFRFSHQYTARNVMTITTNASFAGSLSNGVVTGVVTINWSGEGMPSPPTITRESAVGTFNVTLQKQ